MSKRRIAMVCGKLCEAPEGDYFVTCSFDQNHVILRSRLPYHIVKCVKQHPGHNKIQCPYDSTEYIDSDKFKDHILNCESARSIEDEKYEIARLRASGKMCNIQQTPFHHESGFQQEEEWGGPAIQNDVVDDYNENCFDDLRPVGRGMRRRNRNEDQKPKKGLGRAEMLKRLMDNYASQSSSHSSNSSSSSTDALRRDTFDGQFDDE